MTPNPSPYGLNSSPEGDNTCNSVWDRDKDNRIKRSKLNIELYALTYGRHHQPPISKKLYQKRKRLNYKQYCRLLKDEISMTLKFMHLADSIPTTLELLESPIYNFITLAAKDCGCEGTT